MSRLIDGDYLYDRLVANKCPYELVLQMIKEEPTVCDIDAIKAEIYEEFMTVDGGIHDVSARKCLQIIDKHMKGDSE